MELAEAAEKQCGTDKLSESDIALARLYKKHGEVYINSKTVLLCLVKIKDLIDIPRLKDHLLEHEVILMEQLDEITNPLHSYGDRVDNLLTCVGRVGGRHGHFLLYVSLCESSERHRAHKEAVHELRKKAKELGVVAPESILCAYRMLQQQRLKQDDESSTDKQDSGYESNMDDLIYRCNCGGDCSLHDYLNGSGCQKPTKKGFQYLQLPSDSYEATQLEITLSKQSKALSKEFVQHVSIETFRQLNKISFEDVKRYAKHMISTGNYENVTSGDQPVTTCIAETTTLEQLEDVLMQYYSWFNFALLKDLRKNFLFPERTDDLLQNYEEKFSHYCKRRCFESPLPFHPKPVSVNLTSLVFKVDKMFGDYTLIDVQQITEIVADVINSPKHAIYVKSVEEGCVEVSCYILPQFQLRHLSDLQISQLKENDIFSFKMEDKELMPPCQHHLYQDDNPEQPESSSDHEGYDASSEESDSEDTPSIISDEGTFEAADDNNKEDKDFDIPPSPASPETTYEENPDNSAFTDGSSKFNFSAPAVRTAASKWQNGIRNSPPQSNHMLSKEKEESETDYSDMEDTGYVIQQNSNVHTQEMPTATEATDERASTVCALLCTLSKPKSPMQERAIIYITDSDIYLIVEFKFDPRVVSPQSRLRGKFKPLWTASYDCKKVKHGAKHPPVADSADVSCENEDAISFHFNLPATELALHSISVINSVPELRFDASPKVPTITEEDVATICRLASEETRPEFLYVKIPESHPFYGRHDKNYCPKCLQRTSMGVTLYEADYIMKCLLIGMQSNKEKTEFWSWQKKSKLVGLATVVNFPKDKPPGSVFMSRESARKEKKQNEIAFPQEPKIVVDSNSLYSKYIIYHNKTLFHKMPKLIKLSLSAEWLKEEKISPRWMMTFTSEPSYYGVITSQNQTTSRSSMSVDVTKETKTLHPPPHLSSQVTKITHTTTVKEIVDDYMCVHRHSVPYGPIRANILGLCEEVSAREIPVNVEQPKPTRSNGETRRVDQYFHRGSTTGIQAQRDVIHGEIRPADRQEFALISGKFKRDWKKGSCPAVKYVFVVTNSTLKGKWRLYRQQLCIKTCEQYYYGTSLTCNITSLPQKLCADKSCGICGISSDGLDTKLIRHNIQFQRFGHGFYLAPNSSKCHDYTQGANGYRAMLLCDVCPGRKYPLQKNSHNLTGPPPGYDSIEGIVTANGNLYHHEIVVHNPHAVMPRYIIIYRKDGVAHPLGV